MMDEDHVPDDDRDEFNDETFNTTDFKDEFDFSSTPKPPPKKKHLTLEEVEAEMREQQRRNISAPQLSPSSDPVKIPKKNNVQPATYLDGFTSSSLNHSRPSPISAAPISSSFPLRQMTMGFKEIQIKDPYKGLMTQEEKDNIARIQLNQLTSNNPKLDDFYYLSFINRTTEKQEYILTLSLPRPHYRKPHLAEISKEGALGKIVYNTIRNPKPLLKIKKEDKMTLPTRLATRRVLGAIESIYQSLLQFEDSLEEEETNFDFNVLFKTWMAEERGGVPCGIHCLGYSKGKKLFKRISKHLDGVQKQQWIEAMFNHFEWLDVAHALASTDQTDSFIQCVLLPLVPFLNEAEPSSLVAWLTLLVNKPQILKVLMSKAGLVALCILLSRGEGLKDEDSSFHPQWNECVNKLYGALKGRVLDLFPAITDNAHYVWRFLALLVTNLTVEDRHSLVVEARDRVIATVEANNQEWIADLNIFLNAIGLDAAQLSN